MHHLANPEKSLILLKPTAQIAHEGGQRFKHDSREYRILREWIAAGLPKGAPVTVEGYPHPSTDPAGKRLDTFSVINLVNYPGKPEKQSSRPRR